MTELLIDKKKFFVIPQKEYFKLQKKAALKTKIEKTYTINDARSYSKKLINEWAEEK
jgi:hypothetical protein